MKQCPSFFYSSGFCNCLVCRLIIYFNDLHKTPNKSCLVLLNHNIVLSQKSHCAKLCSIMNKDSLDGFSWYTCAALPHVQSIINCCLELDGVYLMMSLGTTSIPKQWCWTQDLLFPGGQRPRTSPSWADITVAWFSVQCKNLKELLLEF